MSDDVDITQAREERMQAIFWAQHTPAQFAEMMNQARFCCDCGKLIPAQRVKAVPHCSRCVDCQELAEQ
ncbi:TraR/DksA C4-type zinc finger protein [Testudinibacter sp. TR-2022]|uniref:TraR/DksA C4-type zinc finger protein n=1 Tax=Testudinibacter sp. TR-2022 TaxID=2585029 RepID=UPI0022776561|nr:TraR/DksA C4-type zinc finger protein [Testudinibacter sp. TR-2022]